MPWTACDMICTPTTSSLFSGSSPVGGRTRNSREKSGCYQLHYRAVFKTNKNLSLSNRLHKLVLWQNTKVATLARQTARAKSTKRNAAITRQCISGQAATELNPARQQGIATAQGRKVSKVAAKAARITGPVSFGHAVATNQLATNHSLTK